MTTNSRTDRGKLPQSIRIFGKRWEVFRKRVKGDLGSCEIGHTRMNVNPEQSLESMRDTIWHESIHAIEDEMGLNLSEKQVKGIATGTLATLRDNPGLVRFLTD